MTLLDDVAGHVAGDVAGHVAGDVVGRHANTINETRTDCSAQSNDEVSRRDFWMLDIQSHTSSQRSSLATIERDCMGRFYYFYVTHAQYDFVVCPIN